MVFGDHRFRVSGKRTRIARRYENRSRRGVRGGNSAERACAKGRPQAALQQAGPQLVRRHVARCCSVRFSNAFFVGRHVDHNGFENTPLTAIDLGDSAARRGNESNGRIALLLKQGLADGHLLPFADEHLGFQSHVIRAQDCNGINSLRSINDRRGCSADRNVQAFDRYDAS